MTTPRLPVSLLCLGTLAARAALAQSVPFTVAAGLVQSMWCGVDVPLSAAPGRYAGEATVIADGFAPVTIPLVITVRPEAVRAGGADEPWKLTRLKWLNSTIGQRNDVIRPYVPIVVSGRTLRFLGRSGSSGMRSA